MGSTATATVKGGLFEQYGTTISGLGAIGSGRFSIAQLLSRRGNLALRARLLGLDGVAPGAVVAKTIARVEANAEQGGKRTIETQTLINRATTNADVTEINNDLLNLTSRTTFGANPPVNKDGNPLGTR